MSEQRIDGMTYEEVKSNVEAFGRDAWEYEQKASRARKSHTRQRWEERAKEARNMKAEDEARLERFATPVRSSWRDPNGRQGQPVIPANPYNKE